MKRHLCWRLDFTGMMPVVPSWKLSGWLRDIECMTQERGKTSSRQRWPSVALSSASLALCCKNFHFVLKFQACYITIEDLLWYVILLNYLLTIPWHLVRNHMISRSWFSSSPHDVEAHLLLKIFKLFTGTVAVLLSPVSAKHLYSHKIFSLLIVSLIANIFCALSSQPYTKGPFHVAEKGITVTYIRNVHTQWNTSLNAPLISSQNSLTGSGSCSFSKGSCAMSLWHCSKLYWC